MVKAHLYAIRKLRDKKPGEVAERLMSELMRHIVKMFNVNRETDVNELTHSKLKAWVGVHTLLRSWRRPDRKRPRIIVLYVQGVSALLLLPWHGRLLTLAMQ